MPARLRRGLGGIHVCTVPALVRRFRRDGFRAPDSVEVTPTATPGVRRWPRRQPGGHSKLRQAATPAARSRRKAATS